MSEEITSSSPGTEESTVSLAGVDSGATSVPEPRPSMLYNPNSGKLDVKKLATWLAAIAGFIASASFVGAHVTEWTRWWLDLEDTETRLVSCEERIEQLEGSLPVEWRMTDTPSPGDPNARLSMALPSISQHLRDGTKERRRHDLAIIRLSTIHEFGLTRSRERAAAVEARQAVRERDPDEDAGSTRAAPDNSLSDLANL